MAHLVGKPAPSITGVKDQDGKPFDSTGVIGKTPVVLFFYPQAMTTGCTKEACSLRDLNNGPTFAQADKAPVMRIIGVSSDSVEKQKEFADKHSLNYTLLADTEKKVREAYGVGGTALLGLVAQRVTFIIDSKGIIRDTENSSINMKAHSRLVEKWLPVIKKESESAASAPAPTGTAPAAVSTTATEGSVPATTTTAAPAAPAASAAAPPA